MLFGGIINPHQRDFCCPIKFEFIKETNINTAKEYKFYSDEIDLLEESSVTVNNCVLKVRHEVPR